MKRVLNGAILAALIGAMALLSIGADTVHSQGLECTEEKEGLVERTNPFTGETVIRPGTYTEFDDDCAFIQDGRENAQDKAAGAAIFCTTAGVDVFDLDISGRGTLAFRATWDEVEAVPAVPTENTLIDTDGIIGLYRLTTGEMQVNAFTEDYPPREYVFIWEGCTREDAAAN
ncbi:MAG: hypothetical protein AAF653_13010 [Chloroflexota bacterium]